MFFSQPATDRLHMRITKSVLFYTVALFVLFVLSATASLNSSYSVLQGSTPSSSMISCGQTITQDTTLIKNLHCTGNGIIIGANGVTLNCAGHSITGNLSFYAGVNLTSTTGTVIENCKVSDFDFGFFMATGSNATFTGNIVRGNFYDGFYLPTSNNTLVNNSAFGTRGSGFEVTGSFNTLQNDTAKNSGGNGFTLAGSYDVIADNSAINNSYHGGFCGFDFGGGHDNLFEDNLANHNYCGIYITSSGAETNRLNLIENNTADYNFLLGYEIAFSLHNKIVGNTAEYNRGMGFDFGLSSSSLSHNTASQNRGDGFYFEGSTANNTVRFNIADNNTRYGFGDSSHGNGTSGTANTYANDECSGNVKGGSNRSGLCTG
jgi:parallel beta-helix repeat protein